MPTPNLFFIGAPRSATTSMARYLSSHPAIMGSSPKEPMFHAPDLYDPGRIGDTDRYLALFARGNASHRMDASTWYLYSEKAAASIAEMSPEARIIIHLRDPCDFITSLHGHHRFVGLEPEPDLERAVFGEREVTRGDFRLSLDYLAAASYASQIDRFASLFPRDRIHINLFGDLARDPQATYLATLRFLDVPEIPLDEYRRFHGRVQHRSAAVARVTTALGSRQAPKWRRRAMSRIVRLNTVRNEDVASRVVRGKIVDALEPEIRRLEEMLGEDLSSWLIR